MADLAFGEGSSLPNSQPPDLPGGLCIVQASVCKSESGDGFAACTLHLQCWLMQVSQGPLVALTSSTTDAKLEAAQMLPERQIWFGPATGGIVNLQQGA